MSYPRHGPDTSVNDRVVGDASVRYASLDEVSRAIARLGPGCSIIKMDISAAFRCLALRPSAWHLLGIRWDGMWYVDCHLPFGLRTAPAVFERFGDALAYAVSRLLGNRCICWRYADDHGILVPPALDPTQVLIQVNRLWASLGIRLAYNKTELGPCVRLLGVLVHTPSNTMALDAERLARLRALTAAASGWQAVPRKQLESLLGTLLWASRCVRAARPFLAAPLSDLRGHDRTTPLVTISATTREDMRWWHRFATEWNGVSLAVTGPAIDNQALSLFTDATLSMGGAFFQGEHFSVTFPEGLRGSDINICELATLVLAVATWAPRLAGNDLTLLCRCDNSTAVNQMASGAARPPLAAQLLRRLHHIAALGGFAVAVQFIPGVLNTSADALSRLQMERLRAHHAGETLSPVAAAPWSTLGF